MTKDALLFVGYEESSGTVISVGGVAVLGIRGAYSPPILAEKKKFSGGADWDRGFAMGYADCKHFPGSDISEHMGRIPSAGGSAKVDEIARGYEAGWAKCKKELRLYPSKPLGEIRPAGYTPPPTPTPAPISAPQPRAPAPNEATQNTASSSMFNLAVRGW